MIERQLSSHLGPGAEAQLVTMEPPVADPSDEAARKAEKAAREEMKAAAKAADKAADAQNWRAKTRLDYDKIILNWLKFSLTLVSTGIALERALQYLESANSAARLDPYSLLRFVGYGLAALGLGSLCIASKQHRDSLRAIDRGQPLPEPPFSLSLVVAVGVGVLVIVALASVSISGLRPFA